MIIKNEQKLKKRFLGDKQIIHIYLGDKNIYNSFDGIILPQNTERNEVTGGWIATRNPNLININDDGIVMYGPAQSLNTTIIASTVNAIDLAEYNKMTVEYRWFNRLINDTRENVEIRILTSETGWTPFILDRSKQSTTKKFNLSDSDKGVFKVEIVSNFYRDGAISAINSIKFTKE